MTGVLHTAVVACGWWWLSLGSICSAFASLVSAAESLWSLITNPIGFLFQLVWTAGCKGSVCGSQSVKGFLTGTISDKLAGPYQSVFYALMPTGWMIAAMAGTMRIVRGVYDERTDGVHIITDTLVRCGGVLLVLGPPFGDTSLVWDVMNILIGNGSPAGTVVGNGAAGNVGAIATINQQVINVLGSSNVWGGNFSYSGWLETFGMLSAASLIGVPIVGWIPAICLVIVLLGLCYIAGLLVLRMVMLTFAVALAPICIATLAFETKNKFFTWWSELFLAALLMPIVTTICLVITVGVASRFSPQAISGGGNILSNIGDVFITTVVLLCGIWFTGKMIHQLTWRHFTHGGLAGAITAASSVAMAIPSIANDVRSMAAAGGFKIKQGGLLDNLASGKVSQMRFAEGGYAGAAASHGAGGSGGGGGGVGGADLGGQLSGSDAAAVNDAGGSAAFNQFAGEALSGSGPTGQSLANGMGNLPKQTQAAMARAAVPHFLSNDSQGAAKAMSRLAPH